MTQILQVSFFTTLLGTAILLCVPLLLAALGETVNQLTGVLNIGIEGTMLVGALAAFAVAREYESNWLALLMSVGVGLVCALVLSWLFVTVKADQVVVGLAFNALALGVCSYIYATRYAGSGAQSVPGFDNISVPWLSAIPVLGGVVFSQPAPVYLTVIVIFVMAYVVRRTALGLTIQGVGEHPRAADAAGLSVEAIRYLGVLTSGAFSGLAGGVLMLTAANGYRDTVISGKGFIAVAIVILGGWSIYKVAVAALVFGLVDALQLSLQSADVSVVPQLMFALPYLLTAFAVSGLVGQRRQPRALLVPYVRN